MLESLSISIRVNFSVTLHQNSMVAVERLCFVHSAVDDCLLRFVEEDNMRHSLLIVNFRNFNYILQKCAQY